MTTQFINILARKIAEKSSSPISIIDDNTIRVNQENAVTIHLQLDPSLEDEAYAIESTFDGVKVTGQQPRSLLYGNGKLLRDASYDHQKFYLGEWRGISKPDKKLRGIYFATHFRNYYHVAPLPEIDRYIEDLALWGFNIVKVWYDMHHFTSIDDPEAVAFLERLAHIFETTRSLGLMTYFGGLGNEAYADSPQELRADWHQQGDYRGGLGSHYHVELCPSKPGAAAQIVQWKQEALEYFMQRGIAIDFVGLGSYDQGGCTCAKCSPWGGNGFIKICQETAAMIRRISPQTKIITATWLFEYFIDGEWEGLRAALEADRSWTDYLLWDYNSSAGTGDTFILDPFLEKMGVPGDLPLVGFPEISMFNTLPFGGWGANPQPGYLQELWEKAGKLYQGGFPYSEGIYEDINKIICAQLYWNSSRSAEDILREYICYEFSPEVAGDVQRAIMLMGASYFRDVFDQDSKPLFKYGYWGTEPRFVIKNPEHVNEIFTLINSANERLDSSSQKRWRWRVLYLRALIDKELVQQDGAITDACEAALEELEALYYAQDSSSSTSPPTRNSLKTFRPQ